MVDPVIVSFPVGCIGWPETRDEPIFPIENGRIKTHHFYRHRCHVHVRGK